MSCDSSELESDNGAVAGRDDDGGAIRHAPGCICPPHRGFSSGSDRHMLWNIRTGRDRRCGAFRRGGSSSACPAAWRAGDGHGGMGVLPDASLSSASDDEDVLRSGSLLASASTSAITEEGADELGAGGLGYRWWRGSRRPAALPRSAGFERDG